MEKLTLEELVEVIHDYIRNNYDYNNADIFEDTISYYLENGKIINVYINLESESE